jgi:hypothetical protein
LSNYGKKGEKKLMLRTALWQVESSLAYGCIWQALEKQ